MLLTCETHDRLVQAQLMQLMQENKKFKDPFLYFTEPRYFPYYTMKKKLEYWKINTCKLKMVFTCENHDPLVQTQLMQLMEGN